MQDDSFIIAVAMKADGELAVIPETEEVMFFHKGPDGWVVDRTIGFDFKDANGLCGMRKRLYEMSKELTEVKAMVAKGYPGISMEVLSRAGFTLYQLDGFDEEVLTDIGAQSLDAQRSYPLVPKEPYETEEGSGTFFLDLRRALNTYPELTTKKILRPFFDSKKFATLNVIYDHLPPWLPEELGQRGFGWDSGEVPGGVLITITGECERPCR
jgi:Fe-only nitrogenase accessory protein AnfO